MKTKVLILIVAFLQSVGLKGLANKIDPINKFSKDSETPQDTGSNWNVRIIIKSKND